VSIQRKTYAGISTNNKGEFLFETEETDEARII
jgi:hypothetical protein